MTADRATATIPPRFRRGTAQDADTLAQFIEFASEGLALQLWRTIAGPGHDPWSIGRGRVLSGAAGLSFRNAVLAELTDRPAAALIGYPLAEAPEPVPAELPPMLVPLHELTNQVPGTWYVHALAASPEFRGRGLGSALLAMADDLATATGKPGLSLVVSDTNAAARRLYERCGYRERARSEMVKDGWQHPGTAWILMTKTL